MNSVEEVNVMCKRKFRFVKQYLPAGIRFVACRLFLLFLLLNPSSIIYAQTLNFKNLSIDDGLSSSHVFDITEDANGFLWLATNRGISRFDGSEFINLNAGDGYTGRGSYRIYKSSANELWIVTVDYKLFHYSNRKCKQVKLSFDIAWIIENDKHEMIGISRAGKLFRLTGSSQMCEVLLDLKMEFGNTIFFTICHVGSEKYLVSSSEGIFEIDTKTKRQRGVLVNKASHTFKAPRVFKSVDGHVYLFTASALYSLQNNKEGAYSFLKIRDTKGEDIISLCKDTLFGGLWVGTSKGLFLLKESDGIFKQVHYLKDMVCHNVFISKEGILWCTTRENGVFYAYIGASHFTKGAGLENERISFLRKDGNTIYAIAKVGRIALIENGQVIENRDLNREADFAVIHNAANCEDGIYLVLQENIFLKIFNKSVSKIVNPAGYYPLFANNKLYYSINGANYYSNPIRPWYKSDPHSKLRKLITKELQGNGFIGVIHDSLLIHTSRNGFFVMHVNNPDSIDYHIINTGITSFVQTNKGTRFFSTPDKGIYIEHYNGTRYFYDSRKMLLSDFCSKLFYHNKEVWAATDKGISRLILDKNDKITKVINYTGEDKLISSEVNDILFDNGVVYVATNRGISLFAEQIPRSGQTSPEVVLDRIQINNKDTVIRDSYILPFTQNNISITYNSPSIRSAKNMQYKYVIVGKKNRTIYGVSSSKELQLGSLAPDEYSVNIWARNIDGVWSETPAKVLIRILQPFWERLEFIVMVTAIVLIVLLLIIVRRVNQVKERSRMQALLSDSELKALRLHMNPHFIFNTLNSFQKFILEHNPLEANKYISKFSKLMRWIMIYSDRQYLSLEEELLFLDTYIELEQLRFDTVFKVSKQIDKELIPSQVFIPALVIQPFVENAIKYGITGIAYQGILKLVFEHRSDYLKVTIEDNGVGRMVVKQEQHLSGKEYESTGIKYTNERLLLLLERKLKITNAVTVTDLYEDGKPSGTKVELIIPYHNE